MASNSHSGLTGGAQDYLMLPKDLSTAVFKRDGWKCRNPRCQSRNNLHPHHLKHKSKGGKDTLENLITICADCHREHHDGRLKITLGGQFYEVKKKNL
jgi:5-methylcytosine-specific restriction endonuclease McrA